MVAAQHKGASGRALWGEGAAWHAAVPRLRRTGGVAWVLLVGWRTLAAAALKALS